MDAVGVKMLKVPAFCKEASLIGFFFVAFLGVNWGALVLGRVALTSLNENKTHFCDDASCVCAPRACLNKVSTSSQLPAVTYCIGTHRLLLLLESLLMPSSGRGF